MRVQEKEKNGLELYTIRTINEVGTQGLAKGVN